jgi:hypothetical protein
MKPLLALVLLISGVSVATAQEGGGVCGLSTAQVPGIGELRLGMTVEQVLALFPGSSQDAAVRSSLSRPVTPVGTSNFSITPDKYQSKDKYVGVSRIAFSLLDGRVSTISISYDGPEWPNVDKFVEKVTEGTNLPPSGEWRAYPGLDTQLKYLTCTDFEIRVFAGGQGGNLNYVLMNDLTAARTLKDRRLKAREKAGQEPKP